MTKLYYYFIIMALALYSGLAEPIKHLHVKFGVLNAVFSLPLTLQEKDPAEFEYVGFDDNFKCYLYSYPNDPRVILLFDCCGNIAGIRTGYIKADVPKRAQENNVEFEWSYDDKPMFTSGTYWGYDLWYNTVLFVSPDVLTACDNCSNCPLNDEVWLKLDGCWTEISQSECDIEKQGFVKQACFIGMGQHYYYKTSKDTACKDIPGVFVLYEYAKIVGVGLIPFGTFTATERTWFEDPLVIIDEAIVPNRPSCMSTWLTNYGMTGFHIFFKRYPLLSFCFWPWQDSSRCSSS